MQVYDNCFVSKSSTVSDSPPVLRRHTYIRISDLDYVVCTCMCVHDLQCWVSLPRSAPADGQTRTCMPRTRISRKH